MPIDHCLGEGAVGGMGESPSGSLIPRKTRWWSVNGRDGGRGWGGVGVAPPNNVLGLFTSSHEASPQGRELIEMGALQNYPPNAASTPFHPAMPTCSKGTNLLPRGSRQGFILRYWEGVAEFLLG